MDKETFHNSLINYYWSYKFKKYARGNSVVVEVLLRDSLSEYALSFLNVIDKNKRENTIKEILNWVMDYTIMSGHTNRDKSIKPAKDINKLISKLTNMQKELNIYSDSSIEEILGDYLFCFDECDISVIHKTIKLMDTLKRDLSEGKKSKGAFKYFPSNYFYNDEKSTKQDLINILNKTTKEFNIKGESFNIKNIVNNIVLYGE